MPHLHQINKTLWVDLDRIICVEIVPASGAGEKSKSLVLITLEGAKDRITLIAENPNTSTTFVNTLMRAQSRLHQRVAISEAPALDSEDEQA